jgi:aryl-alcohol dehydrogenase-like predicted oxidoreductase
MHSGELTSCGTADWLSGRRRLGWTHLQVAPLCLGTMQFGWSMPSVAAMDLLDSYAEAGGNFIDTADMYGPDQTRRSWAAARPHVGVSEQVIGRWLRDRGHRDRFVIATKVRAQMWDGPDGDGLSRKHILRAAEDSLRRLGIETIDLYQAHWPDDTVPAEETLAAFQELIDTGKVRYVGTSNFSASRLQELLQLSRPGRYPRIASEQLRYNLVNRSEYEASLRDLALSAGIGILCYSPLASGFLTGKYTKEASQPTSDRLRFVTQYFTDPGWLLVRELGEIASAHGVPTGAVALAWLLAQPGITSVVVGTNSARDLRQALPAATLQLTPAELGRLSDLGWDTSTIEFRSW